VGEPKRFLYTGGTGSVSSLEIEGTDVLFVIEVTDNNEFIFGGVTFSQLGQTFNFPI